MEPFYFQLTTYVHDLVSYFQKSDIKRIIAIQSVISSSTLKDDKIKNALLSAVQCPNFYKCQEGQKFLAGLFDTNPDFIKEIHKAFKAIIPGRCAINSSWKIRLECTVLHFVH